MSPEEMAMQQALSGGGEMEMESEGGASGPLPPEELMSLAEEFSSVDPELAQLIMQLAQQRGQGVQ